MNDKPIKYRTYLTLGAAVPKPLIVGWVPTKTNYEMIVQGREKELPGYWLYNWQFKGPKFLRPLWGKLFGAVYAGRNCK